MFSEYILSRYLSNIRQRFDVVSWVEEEHEILSHKRFFKQIISEESEENADTDCSKKTSMLKDSLDVIRIGAQNNC